MTIQKLNFDSLDVEQKQAIEYIKEGHNVFITSPGGCGKSYVIPYIKAILKRKRKRVLVTAMTGTAANLISGHTFHTAMCIGIPKPINQFDEEGNMTISKAEALADGIWTSLMNRNKDFVWSGVGAIIVDEVSMMSPDLFEAVDIVAKRIRCNELPFGGIQFIFSGDWYQLPPVDKENRWTVKKYAFESPLWNINISKTVVLKTMHRQGDDLKFANCLNRIRVGIPTDEDIHMIRSCMNKPLLDTQIRPTKLYSTNVAVNKINAEELEKLQQTVMVYKTKISVYTKQTTSSGEELLKPLSKSCHRDKSQNDFYQKKYGCDEKIKLALGAQVMLRVNLDVKEGLVNGSRGIIINFEKYPIVRFLNGIEMIIGPHTWEYNDNNYVIKKTQIPLRLAYALTIHCCQGATLDYVEVDIGSTIFEYGQTYTALSRVKNTKGLYVKHFDPSKIKADPRINEFYTHYIKN